MTASSLNNNNRTSRKTLSNQIDRLDTMLDGLAEGLNDAVALAVKEVVGKVIRETVENAVRESMTRVPVAQPTPAPQPEVQPPKPSFFETLKGLCKALKQIVVQRAGQVTTLTVRGFAWGFSKLQKLLRGPNEWLHRLWQGSQQVGSLLIRLALLSWRNRTLFGSALAVGLVTGMGSYLAGPTIAALIGGMSSAALTAGSLMTVSLCRLVAGGEEA